MAPHTPTPSSVTYCMLALVVDCAVASQRNTLHHISHLRTILILLSPVSFGVWLFSIIPHSEVATDPTPMPNVRIGLDDCVMGGVGERPLHFVFYEPHTLGMGLHACAPPNAPRAAVPRGLGGWAVVPRRRRMAPHTPTPSFVTYCMLALVVDCAVASLRNTLHHICARY